jgi:hypothetical protein
MARQHGQRAGAGTPTAGTDAPRASSLISAREDDRTELAAAIEQIANLAGVPTQERAWFCHRLRDVIITRNKWNAVRFESERRWIARRRRAFTARCIFARAAIDLQKAIADYDQAYGEAARCYEVAPQPIDQLLNDVLDWESRDPPLKLHIAAALARHGARRGRPRGPKMDEFWHFVLTLLVIVIIAGGGLTFDKNRPDRGSLVRALELLRPYVPWLIPQVIPIRSVLHARTIAKQGPQAFTRAIDGKYYLPEERITDKHDGSDRN